MNIALSTVSKFVKGPRAEIGGTPVVDSLPRREFLRLHLPACVDSHLP